MIYIYIDQLCACQVLEAIKASTAPEPFPISKQYKSRKGKKEQGNESGSEGEQDAGVEAAQEPRTVDKVEKKTGKRKSRPKAKVQVEATAGSSYVPAEYAEKRVAFIQKLRNDGHSYEIAKTTWNFSQEKRSLLCGLSVSELKRRRFLPAGATSNPWAK